MIHHDSCIPIDRSMNVTTIGDIMPRKTVLQAVSLPFPEETKRDYLKSARHYRLGRIVIHSGSPNPHPFVTGRSRTAENLRSAATFSVAQLAEGTQ